MKAEWKMWEMGWGESKILSKAHELSVGKSMSAQRQGFEAIVFGLKLKKDFAKMDEAKEAAEKLAKKLLEQALSNL